MAERQASAASPAAKDVLAAEVVPGVGMRVAATAEAEAVLVAGTKAVEVAQAAEVVPEAGVRVAATAAEVAPVVEVAQVDGMRAAVTAVGGGPVVGMRVAAMVAEAVLAEEVGPAAGMRVEATEATEVAPVAECIALLITAAATDRAGTAAGLGWERCVIISLAGHTCTQAEAAVQSARTPRARRAGRQRSNS